MGLSGYNPTTRRDASVITRHSFRNATLIPHKRKLIDILNSSGKTMLLLKPGAQGKERKCSFGCGGAGGQTSQGKALEGDKPGGLPARGGMVTPGSPLIRQVAALQVQLILLITEGLAASQTKGRNFNSSRTRTSKPERTPAKQVMVHGKISDPGGKWGSQQKRVHCRSSVMAMGPMPPSLQEGSELEGTGGPRGFSRKTSQKPDP